MKFIIASDIHGSAYHCRKLMEIIENEQPDRVILLGDILYHGPRNALPAEYDPMTVAGMLSSIQEKIIAVRGNCDAEVDQMVLSFPCMADYATVHADGLSFYLTHGHLADPEHLPSLPAGTIFLSGHIHVKKDEIVNGIRCLNPGSVSIPKDGTHSCLVYENGSFHPITWEMRL